MNFKKNLLVAIICTTPLLGNPPKKPPVSEELVDETITINVKKTSLKTYGWLTAATVGLAGTLYLYHKYNYDNYLKVRIANLKAARETYQDEINATYFHISPDASVRIRDLREGLIEKYRDKSADLASLRKAIPTLKAQFTREQQEVIVALKEHGEEGQKEVDEAFKGDHTIDELYPALLTTLYHLEQQIPYVQNVFLLEEYNEYLNAGPLDNLCTLLMEKFDRSTLNAFEAKTRSLLEQLQKVRLEVFAALENSGELNELFTELNLQYATLEVCFNTIIDQMPYIHGGLFLEEKPEFNTLHECLDDKHAFRINVNQLFGNSDYPFRTLAVCLEKRVTECKKLIANLPQQHSIKGHSDAESSLREQLIVLEALSQEVVLSETYHAETTAYVKEQKRLRRIREEKERLRCLEEERHRQEEMVARLRQEALQSAISLAQIGERPSSLDSSLSRPLAPTSQHSSIWHSDVPSTPAVQVSSVSFSSTPTATMAVPQPVQSSIYLTDQAGRTRVNQAGMTILMTHYQTPQVQQVLQKQVLQKVKL